MTDQLYRAFHRDHPPMEIDFCDHCLAPAQIEPLLRTPLRQLTADNLNRYAWNALSTAGEIDDFKYFLPRLLELFAADNLDFLAATRLLPLLGACSERWLVNERTALEGFLYAWWRSALTTYPSATAPRDMLEGIADAGVSIVPPLAAWERLRGVDSVRQLSNLIHDHALSVAISNDWYVTLDRWLLSPIVREILEEGFGNSDSPEAGADLSRALEILDCWNSISEQPHG